jgi:hypothetical protein
MEVDYRNHQILSNPGELRVFQGPYTRERFQASSAKKKIFHRQGAKFAKPN